MYVKIFMKWDKKETEIEREIRRGKERKTSEKLRINHKRTNKEFRTLQLPRLLGVLPSETDCVYTR
jgi:hypothetical protein